MKPAKQVYQRGVVAGLVLPPLFFALVASAAFLFWTMGASAFSGESDGHYYNLGFFALLLYIAVYTILIIAQALANAFRWPLVNFLHWMIWICLVVFLGTMFYALSGLGVL